MSSQQPHPSQARTLQSRPVAPLQRQQRLPCLPRPANQPTQWMRAKQRQREAERSQTHKPKRQCPQQPRRLQPRPSTRTPAQKVVLRDRPPCQRKCQRRRETFSGTSLSLKPGARCSRPEEKTLSMCSRPQAACWAEATASIRATATGTTTTPHPRPPHKSRTGLRSSMNVTHSEGPKSRRKIMCTAEENTRPAQIVL